MGRSLGILFCGGGILTLISLALPRHFLDSPAYVAGVALVAVIIGAMLLRGALNQGAPSAFILMIAGANVLVSFGAYVSGNPIERRGTVLSVGHTVRVCALLALQAAVQTGIVAICWGLGSPRVGPPTRVRVSGPTRSQLGLHGCHRDRGRHPGPARQQLASRRRSPLPPSLRRLGDRSRLFVDRPPMAGGQRGALPNPRLPE